MKQRAVIKFHSKLGKNASETFWLMQQVYGDESSIITHEWGKINIQNVFILILR